MQDHDKTGGQLLTPLQAAEFLNVKASTLESWRIRGGGPSLPYIKIGRAVRYRSGDLAALVASGTTEPPRAAA